MLNKKSSQQSQSVYRLIINCSLSLHVQPHTWCFWLSVIIQSIHTNSLLLPSFPAELARSCSVAHVFDWGLPLVSGRGEVGSAGRDGPGRIGTELPWAGKQLQPPLRLLLLISPSSVHHYSFLFLSRLTLCLFHPSPGAPLYLFMYQETEMDSHPGKRGEREVNCDCVHIDVCVCVYAHAGFTVYIVCIVTQY